jgi:predicted Zn-dependent peptidase
MAFARLVFGPQPRYGTGLIGSGAFLKAIAASDLRAFHAAYYQPSNATLIVVGDTTADAMTTRLEKAFGGWRPTAAAGRHAAIPPPSPLQQRQPVLVDKSEAEQSQIRIGWVGVARSTPDYFPLLVLNTVLGGSFTSRLNQNLREVHGYAYGASSAFDMRLSSGPFVAAAGVQTDKTAEAVREFFNELNAIRQPISDEELARAKNYIALGLPSEFETATDLSRRLEEMVIYGLPDDYFERYVSNVMAVTGESVRRAAEKYIHPSESVVVVVGDRKMIEAGLRALNLGALRVMSVDEAVP